MASRESDSIYNRVRRILESARTSVARSVNTAQVAAYWLIGREIVEEEQKGRKRAGYGESLLQNLAQRLKSDFGAGYSVHNLKSIRQFYLEYPALMSSRDIGYAVRSQSVLGLLPANMQIRHAARSESWKPGHLHPNPVLPVQGKHRTLSRRQPWNDWNVWNTWNREQVEAGRG